MAGLVVLRRGGLLRLVDQALHDLVEVEVPKRPIEVVGAADRSARLHAPVAIDGLAGHGLEHRAVGTQQRLVKHVGQLFGSHALAPAPASAAALALAAALARLAGAVLVGLGFLTLLLGYTGDGVAGSAKGEVDLERRLIGRPVSGRLHQAGPQRVLDGLAVFERYVAQGLRGIQVLAQRHRDAGGPQFTDESCQEVQHGRLPLSPRCPGRPAPWTPGRCRSGT